MTTRPALTATTAGCKSFPPKNAGTIFVPAFCFAGAIFDFALSSIRLPKLEHRNSKAIRILKPEHYGRNESTRRTVSPVPAIVVSAFGFRASFGLRSFGFQAQLKRKYLTRFQLGRLNVFQVEN
jgi:hypothetical protein